MTCMPIALVLVFTCALLAAPLLTLEYFPFKEEVWENGTLINCMDEYEGLIQWVRETQMYVVLLVFVLIFYATIIVGMLMRFQSTTTPSYKAVPTSA